MKGDSDKIDFEFLRSNIIYYDRQYRTKVCPEGPYTKCMEGYYVWINLVKAGLPLYFTAADPLYSRPDQRSNAPYGMTDKQLFFIHHVDVTDKELDDLFENVRRFVEWFNPEEYLKKRSQRTFTVYDVLNVTAKYGLKHVCYDQFIYPDEGISHLFYLPCDSKNWMLRFYEKQGWVTILKRHKVFHRYINEPGIYYNDYELRTGQYQDVYNITDVDLLLQRSIADYKQKQNEVKILNAGTDFNDTSRF